MVRKIDWESQIGRRLKLRDLHVFSTVVQRGSMAKAAQHLGVSQPAVSEVIADLEHALGVRLLDRGAQGIAPTIYGGALLKRSVAVFDELKQSIRDIEFLADATTGEVRIACTQSLEYTLLPEIILRFCEQYPRVEVYADSTGNLRDFSGLRDRKYDCILQRAPTSFFHESTIDDLNGELLLDERGCCGGGQQLVGPSPQARSRRIGQRTMDFRRAGYLAPCDSGGNLPRAGTEHSQATNNHYVHTISGPPARRRPVPLNVLRLGGAAYDGRSLLCQAADY